MYCGYHQFIGEPDIERGERSAPPRPGNRPLPYREAMEAAERQAFQDYSRDCAGIRLLEWLRREPLTLAQEVEFWERVLRWLPRIFEMKRLIDERVRAGQMSAEEGRMVLRTNIERVFPPGYALGSLETETARARCALSKARWRLIAYQHRGSAPMEQRLLHGFGEPPVAAGPDSPVANTFIQAHRDRWCVPGQVTSALCRPLANPRPIRRVVIHTATSSSTPVPGNQCGNPVPLARIIAALQNPPRPNNPTSAHYYVDRNGDITQMVREANVAFHVIGHNTDTIGIEHADVCNRPDPYTTELYERSAALVRDIATRNRFAISVFGIDTQNVAAATVVGHSSIGGHGDPGPYWDWEYYARLLRWDGVTADRRPVRVVGMGAAGAAVPTGWRSFTRVQVVGGTGVQGCGDNVPGCATCIPNSHCANQNHSYGDTYLRAEANTPGSDIVFNFSVGRPGLYKISLWWPNVQGANPETQVQAEILKAGGPARANGVFDQRSNFGRWNDLANGFTFTVPGAGGAQGTVRVRRASRLAGGVLADACRVLKVG